MLNHMFVSIRDLNLQQGQDKNNKKNNTYTQTATKVGNICGDCTWGTNVSSHVIQEIVSNKRNVLKTQKLISKYLFILGMERGNKILL